MINATISVLVITYNQQNYIGRTLESIICQKQWGLGEIVICDDCSSDETWNVVLKYSNLYPSIIKAFRNKNNLGIYSNLEQTLSLRGDYDLYTITGGDDAMCDGWFMSIQHFIGEQKIDLNSSFAIYSDWKNITPTNKEYVIRNNYIAKGFCAFSLKTRHLIYNRSVLISKKTLSKYKQVELTKGLAISEEMFDYQMSLFSEKNYYLPFIGTIYYSGIGISTKLQTPEYREEEIKKWNYLLTKYNYNRNDRYYLKFYINTLTFTNNSRLEYLINSFYNYLLSFKWGYWRQLKSDLLKLFGMVITYTKSLFK